MRMLIRAHSTELNALHCGRLWWTPLALRRLRVDLLLRLQWWENVVAGCRCSRLSLCEVACEGSVYMRVSWIYSTKSGPTCAQFGAQHVAVFLRSPAIVCFRSQTDKLPTGHFVSSTQILDMLDG
jgi:hypothetical protein